MQHQTGLFSFPSVDRVDDPCFDVNATSQLGNEATMNAHQLVMTNEMRSLYLRLRANNATRKEAERIASDFTTAFPGYGAEEFMRYRSIGWPICDIYRLLRNGTDIAKADPERLSESERILLQEGIPKQIARCIVFAHPAFSECDPLLLRRGIETLKRLECSNRFIETAATDVPSLLYADPIDIENKYAMWLKQRRKSLKEGLQQVIQSSQKVVSTERPNTVTDLSCPDLSQCPCAFANPSRKPNTGRCAIRWEPDPEPRHAQGSQRSERPMASEPVDERKLVTPPSPGQPAKPVQKRAYDFALGSFAAHHAEPEPEAERTVDTTTLEQEFRQAYLYVPTAAEI
jgi:hypothetical protein